MGKGRLEAGLAVGLVLGLAACSGDTSSPLDQCGARGQPRCASSNSSNNNDDDHHGAGSGAGNNAGSNGGFGNTDASAPVLVPHDAGDPDPGETVNPDDPLCGGLEIEPTVEMETIPGNILLIFDKSGSMCDAWGSSTKWQNAYQAVATALEPLKENITVGAVFFPDTPTGSDDCSVPAFGTAPQLGFMSGADFLAAWNSYWMTNISGGQICNRNMPNAIDGATPLLSALQVADGALNASALDNTTSIVIITDGQPNCSGGDSRTDEPLANLSPTVAAWQVAGYKTYVVGLPGLDGGGLDLLNGLAMAGGTNMHIPASDPTSLQTNLAMIIGESVSSTISCHIGLPMEPPNPDDVHLVVVENGVEQDVGRDLGMGGGWAMNSDYSEIVLQGLFCDLAQQGHYDKISVVFGCVELPPLDPPVPPE
jgi:hypothetical protein